MGERILRHSKVYLCGQIEHVGDEDLRWRSDVAAKFHNIEQDIIVWDPLVKPNWMSKDTEDSNVAFNMSAMFEKGQDEELGQRGWAAAAEIRRVCKKLAAKCDFMIARISKKFTYGSIDELEIAANHNTPVFFLFPDGPISTYGIPGCISSFDLRHDYMFSNIEELLCKICDINEGRDSLPQYDPFVWLYLTYPSCI